jgi:hypothetical protein
MPTNKFSQSESSILAPYTRAVSVTPSDTTDLAEVPRAVNFLKGGGGHASMTVILEGDSQSVTLYLSHASIYPIRPRRILATGTDATNIIALY